MSLAHSISHLRTFQPKDLSKDLRRILDEEYLCDMVSLMMRDTPAISTMLEKFGLFVSILLSWRLLREEKPLLSWIRGTFVYRAGMLCLRSTRVLNSMTHKEELEGVIARTLDKCSQYLSRLCADFKGLTPYKSRLDTVWHMYATNRKQSQATASPIGWHTSSAPLPTFQDEELALQAVQAIQGPLQDSRVSESGLYRGMSRLVSCISLETDEEHRLHHVLLTTLE